MDLTGEIWVETKASEGKSYFYNARTRETTWTKPEGPAVKIITQEQVLFYKFLMHLLYFCKEKTSM
jgi:transcription elongation regulator 1